MTSPKGPQDTCSETLPSDMAGPHVQEFTKNTKENMKGPTLVTGPTRVRVRVYIYIYIKYKTYKIYNNICVKVHAKMKLLFCNLYRLHNQIS